MPLKKSLQIFVQPILSSFEAQGSPEVAEGQRAYMRHQFEFYGLKAPVWMGIVRQHLQQNALPAQEDLPALVKYCFTQEQRELQYFGLEILQRVQKKHPAPGTMDLLEWTITHKSWWDTVDWVAKLVGVQCRQFPEQVPTHPGRWIQSENFWLQRVSIIFQLAYRDHTDEALLFRHILAVKDSKEFFLQKASGWALRQYSKSKPQSVKKFLKANPDLAPLTRREANKYL